MNTTLAIGFVFAVSRIWLGFIVEPEPFSWFSVYKDAAHMFIIWLATAWWFQRHAWQWWLFWALNVVEVSVAIWSRI
jgi:hypothetical protein